MQDIDRTIPLWNATKHILGGIDVFTFDRDNPPFDLSGIPRFVIGRLHWDVWMVKKANDCCDPIYTKFEPPVYHLNHKSTPHDYWTRGAQRNRALAVKAGGWENVWNSKWYLSKGQVKRNRHRRNGHIS
jgi:hypothetical protein